MPTDKTQIQSWLVDKIAEVVDLMPQEIDPAMPYSEYGLDSVSAVLVSADLEDWLGVEISPTMTWDFPTIDALSGHLATLVKGA